MGWGYKCTLIYENICGVYLYFLVSVSDQIHKIHALLSGLKPAINMLVKPANGPHIRKLILIRQKNGTNNEIKKCLVLRIILYNNGISRISKQLKMTQPKTDTSMIILSGILKLS